MKFTAARKELLDAVKIVDKAAAVKTQTPILAGVYLKASGSCLELQNNDYSTEIIAKIAANVEVEGETVLICKYFLEMILKLKSEVVTVTTKENFAEILSSGTKYNLLTIDAADFPKVKQEEILQSFTLRLRQKSCRKFQLILTKSEK